MLDATTVGGKRINSKLPWDHVLGGRAHFQRVGAGNLAFLPFRAKVWEGVLLSSKVPPPSRGPATCWEPQEARVPVLVCWGAVMKCHKPGGMQAEMHCLTVLASRSLRSRCGWSWQPRSAGKETVLRASLRASGSRGHSLACQWLSTPPVPTSAPLCACLRVSKFPIFLGHLSYWVRAHPSDLIFSLITSLKTLFPNKVPF